MRRSVIFCALLVLACGAVDARAGFDVSISASDTRQADGSYLYSYALMNAATSTVSISEFDLAVNDPIGLTSITTPSNFITFYNPGDTSITFTAIDGGIAPGSVGVFSFISFSGPGMVSDLIRGLDSSTFNNTDVSGIVVGPATVPEPSSLLLCGLGAIAPLGLALRSRWRREG